MRRLVTASLSAAVLVFSGLMAGAALSQDKVSIKVLSENDKVRVFEATYAPGAENPSPPSSTTRVVRALTAGTLERRYADGKKETVNWKPGMVPGGALVRVLCVSPARPAMNTALSARSNSVPV